MKWRTVPLGEVVKIVGGGTPRKDEKAYWGGQIPWATVKDLTTDYIDLTQEMISESGLNNSAANLVPAGSILLATRMAVGRASRCLRPMAINQDLKGIVAENQEICDQSYLFRFLKSRAAELSRNQSGATVKGIRLDDIRSLPIPLPPLEEQKRIAAILDYADRLRSLREQAIAKLDELSQSLFLDMFGDPVTNPKGWKTCHLESLFSVVSDCPHSTPKYLQTTDGILCVRTSDLVGGFFDWSATRRVSEQGYKDRTRRYQPRPGDIVYSREGERFGIAAVIPEGVRLCLGQRVMVFSVDSAVADAWFAWAVLNSNAVYQQALWSVGGATSPHVNIKDIRRFRTVLPPICEQTEFGRRMALLVRNRSLLMDQLAFTEMLRDSLAQRAFSGELSG